jgi:ABC-type multidrug transport system permease subunit
MKYKWLLTIPALIILLYMIYRELTTSYSWKSSFEALVIAIVFFLYIGWIILYKRKNKNLFERSRIKNEK